MLLCFCHNKRCRVGGAGRCCGVCSEDTSSTSGATQRRWNRARLVLHVMSSMTASLPSLLPPGHVRCVGGEGWMWVVGACLCFFSAQVFAHVHCVCVCVCDCVCACLCVCVCVCVCECVCVCVCTTDKMAIHLQCLACATLQGMYSLGGFLVSMCAAVLLSLQMV